MTSLVVPARFRGPARSGNGGWSAGRLAAHVASVVAAAEAPVVTVRLRRPPPLDVVMEVGEQDGWTVATHDGAVVLQARAAETEPVPVAAVGADEARAAETAYAGLGSHPFPTCFTCGTGREPGDGLRIFPGPVGEGRVAATWTPHPSVGDPGGDGGHATVPVTWAALDCAGAWAAGVDDRPMVLGSITARLEGLPVIGAEHVVVGEVRGRDGRKVSTATTVLLADGRVVGTAEAVWVLVDPDLFN